MKNKKRIIFVISFLIISAIYLFIKIRGEYLETLGIGSKYVDIFKQNVTYKFTVASINFVFLFASTYITTRFIKKGLKKFFEEEKKEMPKIPNKSISLVIGLIVSIFTSNIITQKIILALNSAWFGTNDPIFNVDIGYYIFQKPFIEFLIIYFIGVIVLLSIYTVIYYIIAFNVFFDKGISIETLKKNTFLKQLTTNVIFIAIAISTYTLIKVQDIVISKFINLNDSTSLYGAGITDVTIKMWGYRLFALVILICAILIIKNLKKGEFRKVFLWVLIAPIYLVVLFITIISFDLIYVKPNELDKEKKYIKYNIDYTKNAYNLNIEEVNIEDSGTITNEDIKENEEVIDNINLLNRDTVLASLEEYQTNLGYYSFTNTKASLYSINGKNSLVYVSPREIVSNETRTYNNKTYEYTHGFGVIITSATNTDESGNIKYIQNSFSNEAQSVNISEPRIYFGLQTNEPIITNTKNKEEYDYPISSSTSSKNSYEGTAGLKLNFLDRLILAIKEGNLGLAFSSNLSKDSKIITDRNIIERVKTLMPYLTYDENPYLVATDEGKLVWVIDAYTISNNYPYSQETTVVINNSNTKINYIRNSVKVLVDSYDGTIRFYITDRTDPIAMAYRNIYPNLFENLDTVLPEDIQKHIVYSEFLYNIQADVIQRYHNVEQEVLYRADDVWDIAKENKSKVTALIGTYIKPYYTMVKTIDSNNSSLGLVIPYTVLNKQNLTSYLVGTYSNNQNNLKLYKFSNKNTILGTIQLDALIEQDEKISENMEALNVTGTKITKNIIVVPINNTLLYVEPIYQVMLNESQVPVLKKVIVASGNKVSIGNNLKEALKNLLSQNAVSIEVTAENVDDLIKQIINANNNLKESNSSSDWEMMGKDINKLQGLITELEELTQNKNTINDTNVIEKTNTI